MKTTRNHTLSGWVTFVWVTAACRRGHGCEFQATPGSSVGLGESSRGDLWTVHARRVELKIPRTSLAGEALLEENHVDAKKKKRKRKEKKVGEGSTRSWGPN